MAFRTQEVEAILSGSLDVVSFGKVAGASANYAVKGNDAVLRGRQILAELGVGKLEKVILLLLPHCPELFYLHLALVLNGQVPAILPWPTSRVDAEKYQRNLLHQLRNLPAARLITLPRLAGNVGPGLPFPTSFITVAELNEFEKSFNDKFQVDPVSGTQAASDKGKCLPLDALFLQFSGGTTGTQKCVVVTACMLRNQLDRLRDKLGFTSSDTVVSWLPMYHDMGLIACFWLPLWCGGKSVQMSAADWLLSPERLFEYIEKDQGTYCWLPNFAFSYLARRRESMRGAWNLGSMRAWINCSEPVRFTSMNDFVHAFFDWGVRPEHMQASYAMAETVYAVTQTELGQFPKSVARNRISLPLKGVQRLEFSLPDEIFVSSGSLLPDVEARIVDECGVTTDSAMAGEIELRCPSMFAGYWGSDGFSRECFTQSGWYKTGDYGFIFEQELYVIGRQKDLIIVGGQNVFPEDVESIVNQVDGVYPGRVVAFGVEDEHYGTQSIGIVAEMRFGRDADEKSIERELRARVVTGIGIAPRFVLVVPERWIVKSTAGKISRKDTRDKFMKQLREQSGVWTART